MHGAGVEVGVSTGQYAQCLLGGCKLSKLYLVDCWDLAPNNNDMDQSNETAISNERVTRERFAGNDRVSIVKGFSDEVAKDFQDKFFDFIYIDSLHDYSAVMTDLKSWYPKLKDNGVFAGHDYCNAVPNNGVAFGVIEAVKDFRMKFLGEHHFFTTKEQFPSWIIIK